MPLDPGTLICQRYRIECLHKLGSHGEVYKVHDTILHRRLAIKENLIADPPYQHHFRQEANILAHLRHPHIPRVIDFLAHDGGQFLVMDFVEGENCADWIAHSSLPPDHLIQLLKGVFLALTYLHSSRPPIIHRDVEPSNVILTPDGRAILVDFGFAKVFQAGQPIPRTDQRSDQYSLAATIYALLTRHIPADSLERALGKETYRSASSFNSDVPHRVDIALTRAMEINANDRYPDIDAFWRALLGEG